MWRQAEAESDQNAIDRAKMEEFVARLQQCQSRDLIDQVLSLVLAMIVL